MVIKKMKCRIGAAVKAKVPATQLPFNSSGKTFKKTKTFKAKA